MVVVFCNLVAHTNVEVHLTFRCSIFIQKLFIPLDRFHWLPYKIVHIPDFFKQSVICRLSILQNCFIMSAS